MHVTQVVVRDTPPPSETITIGHLYALGSQTVFKTEGPEFFTDEVEEGDEKGIDDAETKVVRRGRRPQPKGTEDVETK